MRYLQSAVVLFVVFLSVPARSQSDVTVRRKEFKGTDKGFKEAWKHVSDGDLFYSGQGIMYGDAFDQYLKAIDYNNSNPELNYKAGVSALLSDKKELAADYFMKAYTSKNDVADDILLLLGRALQYAGRYDEAIEKLNGYLNRPGKKPADKSDLAMKCIEECVSARSLVKDTLHVTIENLGRNVNSPEDDYAEVLSPDGSTMYFASRRKIPGSNNSYSDFKNDENIYVSRKYQSSWESATSIGKSLTTKFCEAPLFFDKKDNILYLYEGTGNMGDIMMSVNKKGKWSSPRSVPFNINSKKQETSFTISKSGDEIYFVTSDGKDNLGGKDIYFIKKQGDKKWSKPQNAGKGVNTAFDEESVSLSPSGDTLFFSSKGHNTLGGFDIFFSIRNESGEWGEAVNYGYPVNTPWDELFYVTAPEGRGNFYFASNRSGGLGWCDIYYGKATGPEMAAKPVKREEPAIHVPVIPPPAPVRDTTRVTKPANIPAKEPVRSKNLIVTGIIRDAESGKPMAAQIEVTDVINGKVILRSGSGSNDGKFRFTLPSRQSFKIDVHSPAYHSEIQRINVPENYISDTYNVDFKLYKSGPVIGISFQTIYFDQAKTDIPQSAYPALKHDLEVLIGNPDIRIEIVGHTDKTDTEANNFKISEARVKSVVDYLIKNGIDASRIEMSEFGSLKPAANNATAAGRAKNRRVEINVLKF